MKKLILFLSLTVIFASCMRDIDQEESNIVKTSNYSLLTTVFQQHSPEYKALCLQAYNMAAEKLIYDLEHNDYEVAPAVVLDIDETVLDNSPFEAKSIIENTSYPTYWEEWMNEANAKLTPGVEAFLHIADSLGVEIYYISNRKHKYLGKTIENMNMYNLPNTDSSHIWLRTDESSKKARRDKLRKERSIIMLIGDNLNDFDEVFEIDNNEGRTNKVYDLKAKFGLNFIVLPNPMYGEWVKAVLNKSNDHSPAERDSLFKESLISF